MTVYRVATAEDAPRLCEIYNHYVRETAITFECAEPAAEEFSRRIVSTLEKYPYLVCEAEGRVIGYAYASALRTREAFRWSAELSVYLAPDVLGGGYGSGLLRRLLEILRRQGVASAYSCVTAPNPRSERLHRRFGFAEVGRLPKSGYKLGAWHDVTYLYLPLNEYADCPAEVTPFPALPSSEVDALLR